jgi:hypothetical protein
MEVSLAAEGPPYTVGVKGWSAGEKYFDYWQTKENLSLIFRFSQSLSQKKSDHQKIFLSSKAA